MNWGHFPPHKTIMGKTFVEKSDFYENKRRKTHSGSFHLWLGPLHILTGKLKKSKKKGHKKATINEHP